MPPTDADDESVPQEYTDLLQELRVTETGLQILFSLLLTVPFSARFDKVTSFQRGVYLTALLLTATANVVLIAPVAFHRLLFRRHALRSVVTFAGRLALTGLVLLLLAVSTVLFLVSDILFHHSWATLIAGVFGTFTAMLWFVPAFLRRQRG